jgi:tRNA threonylcarbamoyladenosine biosynthesis protein TsaB
MPKPINILAIDTAGTHCSVMLKAGDQAFFRSENTSQRHSRHILGMIDELMGESRIHPDDLQLLAWNAGPGSFTGLRIGASVIQALSYSFNLPVLSLSAMEVLAHMAWRSACPSLAEPTTIAVAVSAQLNDIYWASFLSCPTGLERIEPDQLLQKDILESKIKALGESDLLIGNAWQLVEQVRITETPTVVSAEDVVALAVTKNQQTWLDKPAACLPNYVHNTINWQKRPIYPRL